MREKYPVNKKRFWTAMAVGPTIGPFIIMLFFMGLVSIGETSFSEYTLNPVPLLFIMGTGILFSLPYMLFIGAPTIILIEKYRPKKSIAAFLYIFLASVIPFVSGSILLNLAGPGSLFGAAGLISGIAIAVIMLRQRTDWPKK